MLCSNREGECSIYRFDGGGRKQGLGHRCDEATTKERHGRACEVTPGVMAFVTVAVACWAVVKGDGTHRRTVVHWAENRW